VRVEANHRELAAAPEVPLLRFQAALGLPVWAFGVACGLLAFALLMVPGWLVFGGGARELVLGRALFFGATFGILTAFTTPVYRGAASDLRALAPIIPLPARDLEYLALGITRATSRQLSIAVAIGFAVGVGHSLILWQEHRSIGFIVPQAGATIALWVFMFTTLSKMVINASVFSRLGAIAEPDLLRPSRQAPFGSAAIRPGIFLIGLLCSFPLLFLGESRPSMGVWFALVACILSLAGIVSMPLRGIRDRIRKRRESILVALDHRLEAMGCRELDGVSAQELRDMDTILDMRERVAQAPAWPLDLAGVRRILFYIVLPPLTWAAAAFVEMFIDGIV
jgi:hypothetical protein